MEGRVILGPEGAPGQIDVPLRFAVVEEGIDPKIIATKLDRVAVTVPPNDSNVLFRMSPKGWCSRCRRAAPSIPTWSISASIRCSAAGAEGSRRPKRQADSRQEDGLDGPAYQPRSATTVLFSARMSAITARAPAWVSWAPRLGLVWLPPMKPIGTMPAAWAADTPAGESSTTMQSAGCDPHLAPPHRGTDRAPACRSARRSPKTGRDRKTAADRCFPGSAGRGRAARRRPRISVRAARSGRARHGRWRAARPAAAAGGAGQARGEIRRQTALGSGLDVGQHVGRPPAGEEPGNDLRRDRKSGARRALARPRWPRSPRCRPGRRCSRK